MAVDGWNGQLNLELANSKWNEIRNGNGWMEWSTQSQNNKWTKIRNVSGWMEWSTQSGNSKWK